MTEEDRAFEAKTREFAADLPLDVLPREIVSHDLKRAVINYANNVDADLLIREWEPDYYHAELLGNDVDWFMTNAPCDTVFLRDWGFDAVEDVTVITRRGPHRPLKVTLADAITVRYDARVRFLTAVDEDAPDEQIEAAATYHDEPERGYKAFADDRGSESTTWYSCYTVSFHFPGSHSHPICSNTRCGYSKYLFPLRFR